MANTNIGEKEIRNAVKEILAGADLTQLSSKQIRKKLEAKFETDLSDRKKEIDSIVLELIEAEGESDNKEDEQKDGKKDRQKHGKKDKQEHGEKDGQIDGGKESSGKNSSGGEDSDSDLPEDMSPPVKKKKSQESVSSDELDSDPEKVTDEQLAFYLQEAEQVGRRTRGTKKPPLKKPVKKASTPSDSAKKKSSTYSKECVLSPALAAVMGVEKMKRSDVVKRMWEVVKERDLQDPKNKSYMICDDELYKVFGRKRVKTFGMMKYLTDHIFTPEQYDECFGNS